MNQRLSHYKVPGISIAFIHQEELAWAKGFGVVKASDEKPVTTETIFQAAAKLAEDHDRPKKKQNMRTVEVLAVPDLGRTSDDIVFALDQLATLYQGDGGGLAAKPLTSTDRLARRENGMGSFKKMQILTLLDLLSSKEDQHE